MTKVTAGERLPLPGFADTPGGVISPPGLEADLGELIAQCWAQAPGQRPSFDAVVTALRVMVRAASGSERA